MFCPQCGSNQGNSKKFCTVCGTNLFVVSQALTGQLAPPQPFIAPVHPAMYQAELDRQKDMRKGITMAVLGGSYLLYQLINFLFSAPFTGWRTPFGPTSIIAFIVFAVGISRVISSRVIAGQATMNPTGGNSFASAVIPAQPIRQTHDKLPNPVFSAATPVQESAPHTNELDPVQPAISVMEEETKHLTR